jgi:hypothetical protein
MRWFTVLTTAALLAHASVAATSAHAAVPLPGYADGEASAEVPLPAPGPNDRTLEVTLSFEAPAEGNAEFALAESGAAGPDGTALVVGWDCGEWFVSGDRLRKRFQAPAAPFTGPRALTMGMRLGRGGAPVRVWFVEQGGGVSAAAGFGPDAPEAVLAWLAGSAGAWDTLRATSRGGVSGVSAVVSFTADGSVIIVR